MGHTPNGVCLGIIVEKYNCQYGHFVVINIIVVLQKSTENNKVIVLRANYNTFRS